MQKMRLDYELLFTVFPGSEQTVIDTVCSATETPVTIIGTILPREGGMKLRYANECEERLSVQSWDHLKSGK
jgi:thiamine monophosphate kinase